VAYWSEFPAPVTVTPQSLRCAASGLAEGLAAVHPCEKIGGDKGDEHAFGVRVIRKRARVPRHRRDSARVSACARSKKARTNLQKQVKSLN
jgi:hypothetical protein